ncbi:MAG: amino acid permease [bacterium]
MGKFSAEVHLSREMSVLDVTLIGVGAMIGAGIFVLTGIAAGVAGPALIVTFALNGLVALLTAMSYAELGSCYHDAGGGYLWVKEGLPKWNGFLSGWMSWFAHAVACSLYALGFGAYFEHVLAAAGVSLPHWGFLGPQQLLAAGIAVLFAYVNFRGASETGRIGNFVTMAKIAILLVFVAFGVQLLVGRADWREAFTPFFAHGMGGVFKAMGLTFIAFQGFEVISQCSEEVRNPKRNIPRAVFLSLLIVVPIYLLVAVVALGAVRPEGMTPWDYLASNKETALVEVAKSFFPGGGLMLLVGGLISTMSALNATIYSSSRVAYAMGRDRNFPTFFSKVHAQRFTPHVAISFSLAIVVLMAVSLPIEAVASAADIMFLLLFLQVNVALIRLRAKRPDLDRGFTTPLFPGLTMVAIGLLLFLAIYMLRYSPIAWLVTVAWLAAGLLVYRFYASRREVQHLKKVQALDRLERKDYRVLVPIASARSAASLCNVAVAVAKKNGAEVIVLHVIEVEEGQPLRAGLAIEDGIASLLEGARAGVAAEGIPVRAVVKVSHRISRGIVETADEEGCNFLVVGRSRRPTFVERTFSSIIDGVIQRANCEVSVVHGDVPAERMRRILLPFGGDVHSRLAIEMAPALMAHFQCEVDVLVVNDPRAAIPVRQRREAEAREMVAAHGLAARVEVVEDEDTLRAIVRRAREADLVVIGGRTGEPLTLLLGRSLGQEITEEVTCPVISLIEYEERESFWSSVLQPLGSKGGRSDE